MGRIHVLDDVVINKIAAGEVVERPASVVKELVENALDAGATRVDVSLELGGARSIVVVDDGSGIAAEDAPRALQRHATSKIRGADDLFAIQSMGFRGEALAAIAAVSRLSLATRERQAAEGVKLSVAGGEPPASQPWSGPSGTVITVENLFYNMPVRAKFLKAAATEFSHCLELMQALALCHPTIGFSLSHNGREQFRVAPGAAAASVRGDDGRADDRLPPTTLTLIGEAALRRRAQAVLRDGAPTLVYVQASSRFGDIEALVSPPGVEKATGKQMFCFVNGRWVKDKVLRYGLMRGYHSHLLKGRFPVAILHARVDPSLVDVNVHPAKTELRFQYGSELQNHLALAIRERLRAADWAESPLPTFDDLVPTGQTSHGAAVGLGAAPWPSAGVGSADGAGQSRAQRPASRFTTVTRRSYDGSSTRDPLADGAASLASGPAIWSRQDLDQALGRGGPQGCARGDRDDDLDREPIPAPEGDRRAAAYGDASRALVLPEPIPWDELEFLGAFARCYLLFAAGPRLLVMDQHAFHERVLYERLCRDERLLSCSQPLLVPESVELSPTEVASLRARRHLLAARGFAFEADGDTTITIRAVPALLAGRSLADLFAALAVDPAAPPADSGDEAVDRPYGADAADTNTELARLILATAACHAAVRAGEELGENERRQLLAEARTVDFYHNCPHGRRVFRWWSKAQVAQWFDR